MADLDPTGVLPAAIAAMRLVGVVAKVAGNLAGGANGRGPRFVNTGSAQQSLPVAPIDPECERRAYETINYVLRLLGNRIGEAGLVSIPALGKALTAAVSHIEIQLFSTEANRLFQSLSSKLNDPLVVNSVFTSIYLVGAITAELSRSLPNYKPTYAPLGPQMVQQLFNAAIGDDAFRGNERAIVDALGTLVRTAGLLRPTDMGNTIFPGIQFHFLRS